MLARQHRLLVLGALAALLLAACGARGTPSPPARTPEAAQAETPAGSEPESPSGQPLAPAGLVLYSGRSESLVGPILQQFQQVSGIQVAVRWGSSAEIAATLLEEGDLSPADLFFAQDPGALGAVVNSLAPLPQDVLDRVDPQFRDPDGRWVGISGRARVVVFNTQSVAASELPDDLWGFTDPKWRGRIGWAPANGSFQTMVTAMRILWGEQEARRWLEGVLANQPRVYENNTAIVAATGAGEIEIGFVNHYYLFRFLAEQGEGFPARNYFLADGGPGSLVMVAGAGVLETAKNKEAAFELLRYLLSSEAQLYFAEQTFEYPLVSGVQVHPELTPLGELNAADIDLAELADLQSTLDLLREVGALP